MDKLKFDPTISLSHIILAVGLLVSALTWKASVEFTVAAEAHTRELADTKLSASVERVADILDGLEARVRLNDGHRIADEAQGEWPNR